MKDFDLTINWYNVSDKDKYIKAYINFGAKCPIIESVRHSRMIKLYYAGNRLYFIVDPKLQADKKYTDVLPLTISLNGTGRKRTIGYITRQDVKTYIETGKINYGHYLMQYDPTEELYYIDLGKYRELLKKPVYSKDYELNSILDSLDTIYEPNREYTAEIRRLLFKS